MKQTPFTKIIIILLLIEIIAACNTIYDTSPQTETEIPVPTFNLTETATLIPTHTKIVTSVTSTPEVAPFCEPGSTSVPTSSLCQFPIAEQSSAFCTKKIPYNLILINEGATYEVLNENFTCSDAGQKGTKRMITCTGPMASPFSLRVCDPACAVPTARANVTQCPQGYIYSNLQGCCSQEFQAPSENCVFLELVTTRCVVDCSQYTKESSCSNNSYACIWDKNTRACLSR